MECIVVYNLWNLALPAKDDYMDWKAKLETTKKSVQQESQRRIEENWPKVLQIFRDNVRPAALAAAQNDTAITELILMTYGALPLSLRMLVKKEAFLSFCLSHRDRLVGQASESGV